MIKTVTICDFCGDEIIGEYRKLRQEFTDRGEAYQSSDMCMKCLKMVTDYKRLPVLNTEDLNNAALQ